MKRFYTVVDGQPVEVPGKTCKDCNETFPLTTEYFKQKFSGHKRGARGARSSRGWEPRCHWCVTKRIARKKKDEP